MTRGWWRRNRWGLVALPVAVAATVGATSPRIVEFWWQADLHQRVDSAAVGQTARYTDVAPPATAFEDEQDRAAAGRPRTFGVQLLGVALVPDGASGAPEGTDAWEIRLRFTAVDTDLTLCTVTVVDDDGVRYGGPSGDVLQQAPMCLPRDADGAATFETPTGTWDAAPLVVTGDGVRPAQVWVSMSQWRYVALDVPPAE